MKKNKKIQFSAYLLGSWSALSEAIITGAAFYLVFPQAGFIVAIIITLAGLLTELPGFYDESCQALNILFFQPKIKRKKRIWGAIEFMIKKHHPNAPPLQIKKKIQKRKLPTFLIAVISTINGLAFSTMIFSHITEVFSSVAAIPILLLFFVASVTGIAYGLLTFSSVFEMITINYQKSWKQLKTSILAKKGQKRFLKSSIFLTFIALYLLIVALAIVSTVASWCSQALFCYHNFTQIPQAAIIIKILIWGAVAPCMAFFAITRGISTLIRIKQKFENTHKEENKNTKARKSLNIIVISSICLILHALGEGAIASEQAVHTFDSFVHLLHWNGIAFILAILSTAIPKILIDSYYIYSSKTEQDLNINFENEEKVLAVTIKTTSQKSLAPASNKEQLWYYQTGPLLSTVI